VDFTRRDDFRQRHCTRESLEVKLEGKRLISVGEW
jgi:hypothetical protein